MRKQVSESKLIHINCKELPQSEGKYQETLVKALILVEQIARIFKVITEWSFFFYLSATNPKIFFR